MRKAELLILQCPLVTVRNRDKGVPSTWEVQFKQSLQIPEEATLLSSCVAETVSGWALVLVLRVPKEETP